MRGYFDSAHFSQRAAPPAILLISSFGLSLSVWSLCMWTPDELVQAFRLCMVWGEGAVTPDWHRDGLGSQTESEALIPTKPPPLLSASLSPMRPHFKVISSQVLVHWLLQNLVKEAEEERLNPCGWSRSWERACFYDKLSPKQVGDRA